ncbi:ribose ABC transporter substrate-binding protein [Rhodococcus sp. WMMA185]|uniref:ABC transporter substrate-binding protein n=1 Tax=Rhodococcus sp. WMMA185 TaxID=679318 RepID=UPI0008782D00|nr:ABC transporter substrate-binding protein [Rhodococcus sp. WMMA185]AOW92008.1 ribose ABC transporter substrate-binding protein [Rhodococcus sp. WMMA185]
MSKKSRRVATIFAIGGAGALVLSACSGAGGSDTKEIAFVQGVAGDEFYISMQCAIEQEAAAEGVAVNTQGPTQFDPSLQKTVLDSVVASRPDAILIAPTDATAMQAPIDAAARQGIEVVLVDATLDDPSVAVSHVASDNVGGGAEAFHAIKQMNPEGGKVLAMDLYPGVSTTNARTEGFEQAVAQDPDFEYLGVQYSHNDPAEAARLMTAALSRDPDIVGVFATNLFASEGTATGIRQANAQDQVKLVGFDAGPAQVNQLRDGTVQALIAQEPATIGKDGVQQAMNALDGNPVTSDIQTGFRVITADNLDTDGAEWVYRSAC